MIDGFIRTLLRPAPGLVDLGQVGGGGVRAYMDSSAASRRSGRFSWLKAKNKVHKKPTPCVAKPAPDGPRPEGPMTLASRKPRIDSWRDGGAGQVQMDSSAAACRSGQLGVAWLFALSETLFGLSNFLAKNVRKNHTVGGGACGLALPGRRTHRDSTRRHQGRFWCRFDGEPIPTYAPA